MCKYLLFLSCLFWTVKCNAQTESRPFIVVLGVAQDGGYPHAGCEKECCVKAHKMPTNGKYVASIALVDPLHEKWWLFDATPDFADQLHLFRSISDKRYNYLPDGIFLTHAHIGHYTGLMQLGREVMNTKGVKTYVMPAMLKFLKENGPWSQLVSLNNIELVPINSEGGNNGFVNLCKEHGIGVSPVIVPHRDEYSETVGFRIKAGGRTCLYIPDINKWGKWTHDIVEEVAAVDVALLDGTFYKGDELPGRNISEVPHPFVSETMQLFMQKSDDKTRAKVHFIHLNHTNPLLWDKRKQAEVEGRGFHLATQGQFFEL